jgi:predicted amidohydrolase YtcJ
MLDRVDVHCIWVSDAVLNLLPDPLPNVPGGEIITNPGKGVFCDNAMDLVMKQWPRPDHTKKTAFVHSAMKELNKVGLVGIHDAGVVPEDVQLYNELADSECWTLRVYAMVECGQRNTFCPDTADKISRDDGLLNVRSVKLFAGKPSNPSSAQHEANRDLDGALGSWGSAMLEPFSDRPDFAGSLLVNATTLKSLTQSWSEAGYQVNIHAIGDRANRLAIDAFFEAYLQLCPEEHPADCQWQHRFRIEHAQIIHPDDQQRMFNAGIIPSIQPTHATSDMPYAENRLGEKRTNEEAYLMRSLLHLQPVLGSDFPVEPPNPFEGMYAAVTRKSPSTGLGKDGAHIGWHVEEALELESALRGFTLSPATAAFLESKAGVILEGAFADWVVLDSPLLDMDIEDLRTLKVQETWVGGKRVYLGRKAG